MSEDKQKPAARTSEQLDALKKWREDFFRARRDVPAARLHEIRSMIVTRPVERDPDSQTPKDS